MSGLDHGWDKGSEPNHADFIHGAVDVDDFEKEVNYAPKRKKKGCKKGKGASCLFTKKVTYNSWDIASKSMWCILTVMTCERCGKYDWSTHGYTVTPYKTQIN